MKKKPVNLSKAELRSQAEVKLNKQKEKTQPVRNVDSLRLIHELEVHQVELEMQNEELLQSRAEVEALLDQYSDLYDFAPVGYFTLARDGVIRQVNLTGANLLSIERGKLIKRRFSLYMDKGSRPIFRNFLEKVFADGEKETCEVELLKDKDHPLWVRIEATPDSARKTCRAIVSDITERKQAENDLRVSEQKFASAFRASPDALIISRRSDGMIIDLNESWERISGYSRAESIGQSSLVMRLFAHPEQRHELIARMPVHDFEIQIRHKSGKLCWASLSSEHIILQGQECLLTILRDITMRKHAEEALRLSEMELQEAQETARIGSWKWDLTKSEVTWSDEMYRIFGIDKNSYTGRLGDVISKVIHPDDLHIVLPSNAQTLAENKPIEYRIILPDKSIRHIWAKSGDAITDDKGKPTFLTGIAQDITERKRAEESLQASDEQFRTLFQTMIQGVVYQDAAGRIISANPAAERILGLSLDQMQGRTSLDPHWHAIHEDGSDFPGETHPAMEALRSRQPVLNIIMGVFHPKTGNYIWINVNAMPLFRPNETAPDQVYATFEDITVRKRAEEALRESENLKNTVLNSLNAHIAVLDSTGMIISVNEPWRRFALENGVAYPLGTIEQVNYLQVLQRAIDSGMEDVANVLQGIQNVLSGARPNFQIEYPCDSPSTKRWFVMNVNPLSSRQGGVVITHENITERKQAEEVLREYEEKLRTVFNTMEEGMALNEMIFDEKGEAIDYRILEVNAAFEEISFLTREQVIGKKATEIYLMQPEQIKAFWKAHQHNEHAIKTDMYIPEIKKWRHISTSKVSGNKFATLFFDNTEQKNAEIALRESEEHLRMALGNSGIILFTQDKELRYTWIYNPNPGFTNGTVLGKTDEELLPPEEAAHLTEIKRGVLKTGIPSQQDVSTTIGDRLFYYRLSIEPLRDQEQNIVGITCASVDITERKQAEETLHLQITALNAAANAIVITTYDGTIEWVNPAFTAYTGYTTEEAIGRNPRELVKSGIQDRAFYSRMWEAILSGKVWHGELINRRKDGSLYTEEETITPLKDANGEIRHFISIKQDVTERKRSENIMQARLRLMQFVATHSLEELLRATLDELELLTGSTIGFYHFVEADQKTLQLQTWSTNTLKEMCKADASLSHYPIDQAGIWVDCVHERGPIIHNDYAALPASQRKGLPDGHAAVIRLLSVPIMRNDRIVAIIGVGNKPQEYDTDDVEVVSQIADLAWDIIDQKRGEGLLEEQLKHLQSLHIIDNAINSSFNLNVTLKILASQIISELKVDAVSILLFNKQSFNLEYAASQGFRSKALQHSSLQLGQGYAGQAIREGRLIHIQDLRLESSVLAQSLQLANEHFITYYGAPLFAKGQIVGVIEVFHRSMLNPTQEWLNFLDTLAAQAAIAIDNAQLFENLQRSNFDLTLAYDATIEGWSHAMDLRDRETEGHTQRVTNLTLKLAQQMGISETDIIHIHRGALLHDMGKMGIPDSILFKPGPLSEQERNIMQQHPIYAHDMLSKINYLKPALDIPYCHHEKWDGTGYPRGLRENQIPFTARIFAIVDVWDAVTSDRPYRAAWTKEKAIEYIKSESGKHFDPDVVIAFLGLIEPMLNQTVQ